MAALLAGSNKKTFVWAFFIVSQILVVSLLWIAFSGTDEREGRIRAALAVDRADSLKAAIARYYAENNMLPADNQALRRADKQGKPYFTAMEEQGDLSYTLNVTNGSITLTFSSSQGAVAGRSLVFSPLIADRKISWVCDAGSLAANYRPAQCRGQ